MTHESSEDPYDSCDMLCCDQLIHETIGSDRQSEYKLGKIDSVRSG